MKDNHKKIQIKKQYYFRNNKPKNIKRMIENHNKLYNLKNKNIFDYRKIYFILYLFIFILKKFSSESNLINPRKLDNTNKITLTVGRGYQRFFYQYMPNKDENTPSYLIINGENNEDFYNEHYLSNDSNIIEIIWDHSLENCNYMFYECKKIISADLSNFDLSKVESIENMFSTCESLVYINLNNSNTNNIKDMKSLFAYCYSLKLVNFGNFDTSSVTDMSSMFEQCKSLESINLSNFNTSSVNNFGCMFCYCKSLTSINLNNFDTSSALDIREMFYQCESLKTVYINNFDTSSVTDMHSMFSQCISLTSLNLSNFNTKKVINFNSMFLQCSELVSLDISHFNGDSVTQAEYMFNECRSLISLNLINFYIPDNAYMDSTFSRMNSELIFCFNESIPSNSQFLYKLTDSIELENNDCSNICFMDNSKLIVNKKICTLNCLDDDKYQFEYNKECVESCPNGTYSLSNNLCQTGFPQNNIIHDSDTSIEIISDSSIEDSSSENSFDSTILSYQSSDSSYVPMTSSLQDSVSSDSIIDNSNSSINNSESYISNDDNIIKESGITNEISNNSLNELCLIYNDSLICKINIFEYFEKNKIDILITNNSNIIHITSTFNQKNNIYNNISNINLGECEERLRQNYSLSENDTIIIYKVDTYEEGYLIPIINYKAYNLNIKEKKLDLDICKGIKIDIFIPVKIDENKLFIYNSSSEFYNDKCYPYTTGNGTDIILQDRREEYMNNHYSLCEKDCEYINYDNTNKQVNCKCPIKIKFPLIDDIKIDPEKFLSNFKNIKETMNTFVMSCYKLLFSKKGIRNNIGSFILIFFIILEIGLTIFFGRFGYQKLINQIDEILKIKKEMEKEGTKRKSISSKKKIKKPIKKKTKMQKEKKSKKEGLKIKGESYLKKLKDAKKRNSMFIDSKNSIQSKEDILSIEDIVKYKNDINTEIMKKYNDYELNSFNYQKALKIDKRTYLQYYFSLLKTKHLIIFTFYTNTDYNSRIIKISLFVFSFSLYIAVNALFFSDSTMHIIYENQGSLSFIYHLPQIIFSSLISSAIGIIVKNLSLTEKQILELKENRTLDTSKVKKCLQIKSVFYFILMFLFFLLFWYYLSCFCAVYNNTQIPLIKDTLISFGISLLLSLGLNLIPGIFRLSALKAENKDKKCIYNLAQIIQFLL